MWDEERNSKMDIKDVLAIISVVISALGIFGFVFLTHYFAAKKLQIFYKSLGKDITLKESWKIIWED